MHDLDSGAVDRLSNDPVPRHPCATEEQVRLENWVLGSQVVAEIHLGRELGRAFRAVVTAPQFPGDDRTVGAADGVSRITGDTRETASLARRERRTRAAG